MKTGGIYKTEQESVKALFKDMPGCPDPLFSNNSKKKLLEYVGVSKFEAITICLQTLKQSNDESWYQERSKRITASHFGEVLNRRLSMHPASIIKLILEKV